jgi:hypothetical protein
METVNKMMKHLVEQTGVTPNPTLTLDWLFEVARKLRYFERSFYNAVDSDMVVCQVAKRLDIQQAAADTPQLAMLAVLCKALGYEDE